MLIINRIEIDKIENINLLNSIKLIIIINLNEVLFGERFIKIILKLFNLAKIIVINHNINVKFKMNEILCEVEYI